MIEVKGKLTDKLELNSFRHVSDLIYYDGPILSYFQDKEGRSYLFSWVDCDEVYNRWLIIQTCFADIVSYISKQVSLRYLILSADNDKLYLTDIDSEVNFHNLMNVSKECLPIEYLPAKDVQYNYVPQNSEPEFVKKLELFRQNEDSSKLIGKFYMLNARTGLYRFEDMYSLDTSYGHFTEPFASRLRSYTLNGSYVIIVERKEMKEKGHKATDKLVSVEPVFSE